MRLLTNLFLLFSLMLSGINLNTASKACLENPALLGEYLPEKKEIILCEDNIKLSDLNRNKVLKHETIHVIQDNLAKNESDTILSEPHLTNLVRSRVDSEEALGVILNYNEDFVNQELEARALDDLPSPIISVWLVVSTILNKVSA